MIGRLLAIEVVQMKTRHYLRFLFSLKSLCASAIVEDLLLLLQFVNVEAVEYYCIAHCDFAAFAAVACGWTKDFRS